MTTPTTPPADTAPAPDATAPQATAPEAAAPDCAQHLAQMFPALFSGAPKPIKLRIQNDIQERAPGVFSKQALSGFFRRYTTTTSYLIAVSRAKHRFDLDGQPAGELSDEHRQIAVTELARRRAIRDSRRELEETQRRNRATLLHDFETTTLTPANFCALKGVAVEELDGLLAWARQEAEERRLSARPGAPSPSTPHRRGPPERRPRPAGRRQNGSG
jgi:ProP effector